MNDSEPLMASLTAMGWNRGSRLGGAHGPLHREWLHFCLHDTNLDLLVNFSAFTSTDASRQDDPPVIPRLTVMTRSAHGWTGTTRTYAPEDGGLPGGAFGAWMPDGTVEANGDAIDLRVQIDDPQIELDVRLRPRAFASPTFDVAVDGSPPLNWLVLPRLEATGAATVEGRYHAISGACGYHDHNWGGFLWGADFRWEWGYLLPSDGTSPWTVVAVELTDRGRNRVLERGILIWHGTTLVRSFRADAVEVHRRGFLGRAPRLRTPGPLALLRPGSATDVPAMVRFRGQSRDDAVILELRCEDVAQIIVPDDTGLGVTVVNEVSAVGAVIGKVAGLDLSFEGRGFMEVLGA